MISHNRTLEILLILDVHVVHGQPVSETCVAYRIEVHALRKLGGTQNTYSKKQDHIRIAFQKMSMYTQQKECAICRAQLCYRNACILPRTLPPSQAMRHSRKFDPIIVQSKVSRLFRGRRVNPLSTCAHPYPAGHSVGSDKIVAWMFACAFAGPFKHTDAVLVGSADQCLWCPVTQRVRSS